MTTKNENIDIRELDKDELELVSGGSLFGDLLDAAWSASKWVYHKTFG